MSARSGGLFVGRLIAENGLGTLAEALELYAGARIDVIGAGPEQARLSGHARIRLLGRVGPAEVQERMRGAAYLVLPSLSYEALPRPLVEAFANALPVIASRLGPGGVKGSGLGLAIARELVEAHGGQIAVVAGGAGGHFRVTLPRRSARALADAA